jgi:hypothetical protein
MADASRFPGLALPFAIVGGTAGWLSASLLKNPLLHYRTSREAAAIVATLIALSAGSLIRRLCVGKRYDYEIGEPDPSIRPPTDRGAIHATIVIVGGALTGAITALVSHDLRYVHGFALSGAGMAIVFIPVCLAVVAAARSAQRARQGSIVAASDRRAVWGILAFALALTTLEALPDWAASADLDASPPIPAVLAVVAAALVTLWVLRADRRAIAEAREVIGAGLSARDSTDTAHVDPEATRLDLGLGEGLLERVAHGSAAYRDRARTVALVQGSPESAIASLERATKRGMLAIAGLSAIGVVHLAATTTLARLVYEDTRCGAGHRESCAIAGELVAPIHPELAIQYRARAKSLW